MAEGREHSLASLAEHLRLDLEARGDVWDAPCELAFLYDDDDDGWQLSAMETNAGMWLPHPAAGLAKMAAQITAITARYPSLVGEISTIRPPSWRGLAFFSEAWMVYQEQQTPDEGPDPVFLEMASTRMLSQHPAREESRGWWVTLADGAFVMVNQLRNPRACTSEAEEKTAVIIRPPDRDSKPEFFGTIPTSLGILTTALGMENGS